MTFDNSARPARALHFPLNEQETLDVAEETQGDITKITADFFPSDPTERIDVVFNLSFNEFTTIASAVDIGRDIGYGTQSALVWWTWIRSLIGEGGTMSCEDIADCVDTSEAVQQAISNNNSIVLENLKTIANSGLQYPQIDAETTTIMTSSAGIGDNVDDEIKALPNCNLNALWAGIRDGIVQRLDDNARTVLQFLVSKSDLAERGQALVGAIPIVGSVATAILEQVTEAAPDILNLYESYSSIENLDDIACEIFSLCCGECRYPTFDEVYQYYATLGVTGLNDLENLVASLVMDLLLASTETAALIAYHSLVAIQIWTFYMGSKFYGYSGTESLNRMASLGEDFANDNWILLCDSCNEAYRIVEYDFTSGQHGWYIDSADGNPDEGTYMAGKGFRVSVGNRCEIAMLFENTWSYRSAGFQADGLALTARSMCLRPTQGSTTAQACQGMVTGTMGYNNCQSVPTAGVTGYNEFAIHIQCAAQSPYTFISKAYIIFDADNAPENSIPIASNTKCL